MLIRIEAGKRDKLQQLCMAEGKSTSQVVRELIDGFIKEKDMASHIDSLWTRVGKIMTKKGYSSKDINRIIKQVRKTAK
jgi:hypothetical protein